MQPPKPLKLAHDDLKGSLHEWRRAQEAFEDKYSWTTQERLAPEDITRRIEEAANRIQWRIKELLDFAYASAVVTMCMSNADTGKDFVLNHVNYIQSASKEMADALYDELDSILYYCDDATVFLSWQAVCAGVDSFARSAAQELANFHLKYSGLFDRSFFNALFSAVWSLNETANAAIECRKKGITVHYKGPLCEYALEDAKSLRALIHTDMRDHQD
jgi:hypothetical protein